jgi:anti-sigma B factor antagonist
MGVWGAAVDTSTVTSADGATHTVIITGELDLDGVDQVSQALTEAIEIAGTVKVVADLGPTQFLDSSGINVLIMARNEAERHGVQFRVVNASGLVEEVLQLTGVLQLLQSTEATPPQPTEPVDL